MAVLQPIQLFDCECLTVDCPVLKTAVFWTFDSQLNNLNKHLNI